MAKARMIRFETQTVNPPEVKRTQRPLTQANIARNEGFYSEDEKATESDRKKLVARLIEFLETI